MLLFVEELTSDYIVKFLFGTIDRNQVVSTVMADPSDMISKKTQKIQNKKKMIFLDRKKALFIQNAFLFSNEDILNIPLEEAKHLLNIKSYQCKTLKSKKKYVAFRLKFWNEKLSFFHQLYSN